MAMGFSLVWSYTLDSSLRCGKAYVSSPAQCPLVDKEEKAKCICVFDIVFVFVFEFVFVYLSFGICLLLFIHQRALSQNFHYV